MQSVDKFHITIILSFTGYGHDHQNLYKMMLADQLSWDSTSPGLVNEGHSKEQELLLFWCYSLIVTIFFIESLKIVEFSF